MIIFKGITLYSMLQINYFCKPFLTIDNSCANEMTQCLTDDKFTISYCRKEYLTELFKEKK